jgi:hypothetical protein
MLSSILTSAPFKKKTIRFYGYGPLEKVKKSIWLFTKVFVWICSITMGRKNKLK